MIFNDLFRKRGFHETLLTLYTAKNYALSVTEFNEKLEQETGSYYNAFFRVKEEMKKYGILEHKKNREGEKVIALTRKGVKIMQILNTINDLLGMEFEEYQEIIRKQNKAISLRKRRTTLRNKRTSIDELTENEESEPTDDIKNDSHT